MNRATAGRMPPDAELQLSDDELSRIVRLVHERSGITLHSGKRALVLSRLQRRLRAGGFPTFGDYLAYVEADTEGNELIALLDAIATNHTSFIREPQHFDFLRSHVVPVLTGRNPSIRVWSAGCSSGEEAVSLAVTLLDSLDASRYTSIRVLATDLSTKALSAAAAGIYKMDRVAAIPLDVLRRHFERGLGAQSGQARVAAHVRRLIEYRRVNFFDEPALGERFDVIFCRNVMIYFDRDVQQRVVSYLERHLAPGGFLFISHAESLNRISHRLRWVAPSVYQGADA